MLVKLTSVDSQLIHVYLLEYDAYHCIHISSFSFTSSYCISQELITLLHPQLFLSSPVRIWYSDSP